MQLSDLNRAALGGRETYWWIHMLAAAYCIMIGGFSVFAWIEVGEGFKAGWCAGAQVLAIVCAILGRRAFTGQMRISGVVSLALAGGCAWWAAQGLQHAWQVNGEAISWEMVMFLASLEPGLFLLAEHVQEGREALRAKHAQDAAETSEELRRIRERQDRRDAEEAAERRAKLLPAPLPKNVTRLKPRRVAGATALAVAAALPAGQAAAAPVGAPTIETPRVSMAHAGADPRVAQACALRDKGMFRKEVAQAMGVSERTVTRLWGEANKQAA